MKTRKIDKYLFWIWLAVVMITALILFLSWAQPAQAATPCGSLVGAANTVEVALTAAKVPHMVFVDAQSIASCMAIGCPPPRTICRNWRIRLNATSVRWVDIVFSMSGKFVGVR